MYLKGTPFLRKYISIWQDLEKKKDPVISDGVLLQVYKLEPILMVSDGINHLALNYSESKEKSQNWLKDLMATSCNKSNILQSLYVFKNFTFDFVWNYAEEKLIISLETKSASFMFPGEMHPFIGRTKLLTTSLGSQEQEIFKRKAMQKSIKNNRNDILDDVIGLDEMINNTAATPKEKSSKGKKKMNQNSDQIQNEFDELNDLNDDVLRKNLLNNTFKNSDVNHGKDLVKKTKFSKPTANTEQLKMQKDLNKLTNQVSTDVAIDERPFGQKSGKTSQGKFSIQKSANFDDNEETEQPVMN